MKVVVIEDDDFTYEIIQYNLTEKGITDVTQAVCGNDALALISTAKEEIIWIVDGVFPMNRIGTPRPL